MTTSLAVSRVALLAAPAVISTPYPLPKPAPVRAFLMDPRVFNISVLAGLLMVAAGLAVLFSWPVALVGTGLILIRGAFAAARLTSNRGE